MPNQKLIKAVITVADTKPIVKDDEVIGKTIIATDQKKYGMFFQKRDGSPTQAHLAYEEQGIKEGSRIGIGFVSEPKEWVKDGKTICYEQRTIRMIEDATDINYQEQNLPPENTDQKSSGRDFYAEGLGKCRHGYLLEAYRADKKLNQELLDDIAMWAESSMTGELPKNEEVKSSETEDIPF